MITVACRNFTAFGRPVKVGDIIDTTPSPHENKLITQRYLRPATEAEMTTFEKQSKVTGASPAERASDDSDAVSGKKKAASRKR